MKSKQLTAILPISQSDVLILDSLVQQKQQLQLQLQQWQAIFNEHQNCKFNLYRLLCFLSDDKFRNFGFVLSPSVLFYLLCISCKLCRTRFDLKFSRIRLACQRCIKPADQAVTSNGFNFGIDSESDSNCTSSFRSISAASRINWHLNSNV